MILPPVDRILREFNSGGARFHGIPYGIAFPGQTYLVYYGCKKYVPKNKLVWGHKTSYGVTKFVNLMSNGRWDEPNLDPILIDNFFYDPEKIRLWDEL